MNWLNRNSFRSYPIQENAPKVSTNRWVLPDSILADCFICGSLRGLSVFISSVCVTPKIISVIFSLSDGVCIASVSAVIGKNSPYEKVTVVPLVSGVSGYVSFGEILNESDFQQLALGMHRFSELTILEARTVMDVGSWPVRSINAINGISLSGDVKILHNEELLITSSTDVVDGDIVTSIKVSLKNPADYLSPCENLSSSCECNPISTINRVEGDDNGKITIEIIDASGSILKFGDHGLSFNLLKTGISLCERPLMPDALGRLPDGAGNYDGDSNPSS